MAAKTPQDPFSSRARIAARRPRPPPKAAGLSSPLSPALSLLRSALLARRSRHDAPRLTSVRAVWFGLRLPWGSFGGRRLRVLPVRCGRAPLGLPGFALCLADSRRALRCVGVRRRAALFSPFSPAPPLSPLFLCLAAVRNRMRGRQGRQGLFAPLRGWSLLPLRSIRSQKKAVCFFRSPRLLLLPPRCVAARSSAAGLCYSHFCRQRGGRNGDRPVLLYRLYRGTRNPSRTLRDAPRTP